MKKFLSSTVASKFGLNHTWVGPFMGIEVEVEAERPLPPAGKKWKAVNDGSLRGYATEYVSQPLLPEDAILVTKELYNNIAAAESKIQNSMRAGVHIHVNCQDLTIRELFTFLAAYYCLEELLTEDLGEERQGNLFCLRLSDAEYANASLLYVLQTESVDHNIFTNNNFRYSAVNLVALSRFGTLEFRALKTPTSPEPVIDWIQTLSALYNGAKTFKDPAELLSAMSADGEKEVVKKLLGEKAEKHINKPDFEDKLYFGIRNIQQWVFLTDWSE
jgi:hypothetical protein